MRAKKLFCMLAAVSLLGHGAQLLLTSDAPAAQKNAAGQAQPGHRWLFCPLV